MFDIHYVPKNWGILPQIFGFSSYTLLVGLGIIAGLLYYFYDARERGVNGEKVIFIVAAALFFGTLGAKLPLLIMNYEFIGKRPDIIIEGKTIVGGFLGGIVGVLLIKKLMKIKLRMGNVIAPAVALGMAIGRVGCFLNGCCFGKATAWGVDFGDGILRLPTQLFEVFFHLIAFIMLLYYRKRIEIPGILFKYYISAYLIYRFFLEFFRENQVLWAGMTLYQILCILGLLLVNYKILRSWRTDKVRRT